MIFRNYSDGLADADGLSDDDGLSPCFSYSTNGRPVVGSVVIFVCI